MDLIGQDVDVVEGEHIQHEQKALLDGFFVEVLDLGLFPVFIQVTYFLDRILTMICIFQ